MAVDADNRLLWRYSPRRLEAEVIRDSMLQVSGSLDEQMSGPSYMIWAYVPKATVQFASKDKLGLDTFRRMVYQFVPRIYQDETRSARFDCPDTNLPSPRRTVSTTALQSGSNLWNSPFVLDQWRPLVGQASKGCGERF